ncbi:N-terminal acetyltransferase [Acidilobus saccharovorans 345-15]|uniref:N-terminal acetyltransferase n=1 Tax=Acidilobus saccharovorans (strain DSM 16705 / JCM 18335 / VKM B-2471 / 345-15) TaxID=666510 RepID=D9Q150_ACIS3|nr:N-terminal acetyltransferase [Acidilobus saccharovorans 345-15]
MCQASRPLTPPNRAAWGSLVRLRPYRPEDIEAILRVEEESFPPRQRYTPETFDYLLSLRGSFMIVAEEDGEVAGYALGYVEGRGVGHLASLAVRPAFRRRGIASALLAEAERVLKGEGAVAVKLEVRETNYPAINLYLKFGYRPARRLPRYYGDEDGILMVKVLA